ncbi:MAG: hypothetical protein ACKO0N_08430, partial [Planctomycetota bacterium]
MIGALNKEEMPEELQIEMDDLRQEIDGRNQLVEQTRRKVNDFLHAYRSKPETDPKNATMLQEFLSELETELRPSNVDRLASFTRLSEDDTLAV